MKQPLYYHLFKSIVIVLAFLLFSSQSCNNKKTPECNNNCLSTGPVVIYKTKKDYSNKVSVKLSENKQIITAYPGNKEALRQKPVKLKNGFYFKKMVGNAFLSINIEDYANKNYDQSRDLKEFIIDDDPYTEIYQCCKCLTRNIDSINAFIDQGLLKYCERLN